MVINVEKLYRKILLFWFLSFGTLALCVGWKDARQKGFALNKIRSCFSYDGRWENSMQSKTLPKVLVEVLAQDYVYLGSGAQTYAFSSKDGKYVLKLFKTKPLTPKRYLLLFRSFFPKKASYFYERLDGRLLARENLFASYQLGFERAQEKTGLVYLHLNRSKNLRKRICLWDDKGGRFQIELDDFSFVIQKRANLLRDAITKKMEQRDVQGALFVLRSLFECVAAKSLKEIADRDIGVNHNYGFSIEQNEVIQIDAGDLYLDPSVGTKEFCIKEITRVSKRLDPWLLEYYPHLFEEKERICRQFLSNY